MTSTSKNVCINKLEDLINKYNNKYHRAIKMKPADIKSSINMYGLYLWKIKKVLQLLMI